MKSPAIFDINATDKDLKIWNGETTNLMNLDRNPYQWADQLYKQMREKFWVPQRVDLTPDVNSFAQLTNSERQAYTGILSYLTYLDSIQETMLPKISEVMTAPSVRHCLAEQCYFEGIHSESYKYMIETLYPEKERDSIYYLWESDKILADRCQLITSYYQQYCDTRSDEDYLYALFADYLLEGLYFYNGFAFFYTLSSRQLMQGTGDIISLINRDELDHVRLFSKLLAEAFKTFPYSQDKLLEMVDLAVTKEIEWTHHITNNDVLGIPPHAPELYTKYLADLRLKAINLPPLYNQKINPYQHLEKIANTSSGGDVKGNFFEATVTEYNMSSALDGWEDF
jgi:ribonucleoside-diphosphate reductase beta chain